MKRKFDDDYATCAKTFATLRIYHDDLVPAAISNFLGLQPTQSMQKGKLIEERKFIPKTGGWFLSTDDKITSKDLERHLTWLLRKLIPKKSKVLSLQRRGFRMQISCYWLSAQGQGGPMLSVETMRQLAVLRLELWFDFYGPYEDALPTK